MITDLGQVFTGCLFHPFENEIHQVMIHFFVTVPFCFTFALNVVIYLLFTIESLCIYFLPYATVFHAVNMCDFSYYSNEINVTELNG